MADGSHRLDGLDERAPDQPSAAAPGAGDPDAWWARPAEGAYGSQDAGWGAGSGSGSAAAYRDAGFAPPQGAPAFSAQGAHATYGTATPPPPPPSYPSGPYGAPSGTGPYDSPYATSSDRPWEVRQPWGAPATDSLGGPSAGRGRRRPRLGIAAAVLAGALAGGVAGGSVQALTDDGDDLTDASATLGTGVTPPAPVDRPPGSVAAVAAKVLRSTVSIGVELGSGGSRGGSGSGVVLREDGYVLTNNHVVEAGQASGARITVTVNGSQGREFPAKIVGRDPETDLAVLKVQDPTGLVPATLGRSSDLVIGDPVIAIGSPLGLQGTVTTGIVSQLNREVDISRTEKLLNAIQTDAAINPGNSGGALVDSRGAVIGINSAIATLGGGQTGGNIGVGFAIPVDEARSVAEEIIRTGKATHPAIGVTGEDATAQDGSKEGARVKEVTAAGPAERAGLQPDDVIKKVEDRSVGSIQELVVALRQSKVGDEVTVTYQRDGQTRSADVTLTERK